MRIVFGREKLLSSEAEDEIGEKKSDDENYSGEENDQPKVRVFGVVKMSEGEEVFHGRLDAISPTGGRLRSGDSFRRSASLWPERSSMLKQALAELESKRRDAPEEADR